MSPCPVAIRPLIPLAICLSLGVAGLPSSAWGQCSRTIVVPAAPTGRLVQVDGDTVRGALPDLLREIGRSGGCEFSFPVMPRARAQQEVMGNGRMDMLLPAGRNSSRDRTAQFVPLMREPVALIVRAADQARAPRSLAELRARSNWRGVLVRSYAFNDEYVGLADHLRATRRADLVSDPMSALRMLQAGRVEFALMPPSATHEDGGSLREGLVLQRLADLPAMEFGAYLSRASLSEADRLLLADLLTKAVREGRVRRALLQHFPAELLDWSGKQP